MRDKNEDWKSWVLRCFAINLSILIFLIAAGAAILHVLREDYSNGEIVELHDIVLYGPAFEDNYEIKFGIINEEKPNVVAIGSSRTMQFRSAYFYGKDFYTMGGTAGSIDEARYTFEKIKENYIPKVIILGVDLWWLNPNFKHHNWYETYNEEKGFSNRIAKALEQIFLNRKIRQQLKHLSDIHEKDLYGDRVTVGLSAAVKFDGFRLSDGSYQYGELICKNETIENKFKDTHERIDKGRNRFEYASQIDMGQLNKLHELLRVMANSGAHVIVFLPPFPNEIYSRMYNSNKYKDFLLDFENSVRYICEEEKITFFDCSNLAWIGASEDETIDGFHGSEVAYGRIMKILTDDEILAQYVNVGYLNNLLDNPVSNLLLVPCNL